MNIHTEVTSLYKDYQMASCGFWITRSVNDMSYLLQRSLRPLLLKYIANLYKRMVQLKSHVPHFGRCKWTKHVLLMNDTCFPKLVYKFILNGRRCVGQPKKRWEETNTHVNEKSQKMAYTLLLMTPHWFCTFPLTWYHYKDDSTNKKLRCVCWL